MAVIWKPPIHIAASECELEKRLLCSDVQEQEIGKTIAHCKNTSNEFQWSAETPNVI